MIQRLVCLFLLLPCLWIPVSLHPTLRLPKAQWSQYVRVKNLILISVLFEAEFFPPGFVRIVGIEAPHFYLQIKRDWGLAISEPGSYKSGSVKKILIEILTEISEEILTEILKEILTEISKEILREIFCKSNEIEAAPYLSRDHTKVDQKYKSEY